jgi:tetratricopeptide (TPR) repeat protein
MVENNSVRKVLFHLLLVVVTGGLPVAAQVWRPATSAVVVTKARQLAAAGQTQEAIDLLKSDLEAYPAGLETRLALAALYAGQGDRREAEDELQLAVSDHPSSAQAALALGNFYLGAALYVQAEQVFSNAVRQHPKLAEARIQLTLTLAGEHKYLEAAKNLSQITPPVPAADRAAYYRLAAAIHSGQGQKQAAARDMERALLSSPNDEQLQTLTALTEADASDWKKCARNLAPLVKRNPSARTGLLLLQAQLANHEEPNITLQMLRTLSLPEDQTVQVALRSAGLLSRAGQHKEAAQEFRRVLASRSGAADVRYRLATELDASGETGQALEALAPLREHADSAAVEALAADIEENRGEIADAIRDHQNAVNLAPAEESYRLSLGVALLKNHSFQSAQEIFQKSAELFPNAARSYVGLGIAEYMVEKYEDSVSNLLRAAELDGNSGRILNYLGSTQFENPSGPSERAIQALCAQADSHPRDPISTKWCGALLFRKSYVAGNPSLAQPAVAHLRRTVELAPKDRTANCMLGRTLSWMQHAADARHWLEACVRLDPDSAEEHYRLSRVYQELNLKRAALEQSALAAKLKARSEQGREAGDDFALDQLRASPRNSIQK